jgi:tripartite-type tricarboxylate transporter receptor subunit TctC
VLFGLLAPAGTPPDIVQQLNQAIEEGLRSPQVRSNLEGIGVEARLGTAEDFAAALNVQAREWKTVIDAIGGVQIE